MKYLFIALLLLFACQHQGHSSCMEEHPKLQALYRLPWGSKLKYVDLSQDNLTEMPFLSMYKIEYVNLSHNAIKEAPLRRLPHNVKKVDLSYNQLHDTIVWDESFTPELRNISLTHNQIKLFVPIFLEIDTVLLAHNDIRNIVDIRPVFHHMLIPPSFLRYLDVSNNPLLSDIVFCVDNRDHDSPHIHKIKCDNTPVHNNEWIHNADEGYELIEKIGLSIRLFRQ